MAAGGFSVGLTDRDRAAGDRLRHLTWYEGRGGSLLGFARDGRLVVALYPGDRATEQERSWLRLALAIFATSPLKKRLRAHRA